MLRSDLLLGGLFGIVGAIALGIRSAKLSRRLVLIGIDEIVVGVLLSSPDAIVGEGLSIGFYTNAFSPVLFITNIVSHKA